MYERLTVDSDREVVVFMIGMRLTRLRSVRSWWPVFTAMPKMLRELSKDPSLGMLDARSYISGRDLMLVQYWDSWEKLTAYASASSAEHLPAWKAFNKAVKNGHEAVGIWHESYRAPDGMREALYGGMPPHGLGKVLGTVAPSRRGLSARRRMDVTVPDAPTVLVPS